MEQIRKLSAEKFNGSKKYFVGDSMPLEVCKFSRSSRSRIRKETHYELPNRGYCASQKMHNVLFYHSPKVKRLFKYQL